MGCGYVLVGCGYGFVNRNPRQTRTRGMGLSGFEGFVICLQKNNYINVGVFSNLFIFHTFFLINKLLVTVSVTVLPYQQPSDDNKHDNSDNGQP